MFSSFSYYKRSKNRIYFFIYSKKVNFWPRKASFKAFASLRLQSEAFRGQKNTFFSCEKINYCFLPVFREKNTIVFNCTYLYGAKCFMDAPILIQFFSYNGLDHAKNRDQNRFFMHGMHFFRENI